MSKGLPAREHALFKQTLKCYETKEYKKGIKNADTILNKFPKHGETLAMKGLILNCMNKKEEAYEFVRQGLTCDLKSYLCWHVYGLLYRSDKKYQDAIKCYQNALRHDENNNQILRDLALLQMQIRDFEGFRNTRQQLAALHPKLKTSWMGVAVGYHLLGHYDVALQILDVFSEIHRDKYGKVSYESGEMVMYKMVISYESGDFEKTLDLIDANKDNIVDKAGWELLRVKVLLKLNCQEEAKESIEHLIARNPDCQDYYIIYEQCLFNTDDLLPEYENFKTLYPRAYQPQRRALDVATGDKFKELVNAYLLKGIRKGTPGLFQTLKGLYKDSSKYEIIKDLLKGYLQSYEKTKSLSSDVENPDTPDAHVWLCYFNCQLELMNHNYEEALRLATAILEDTPTLIEGYILKARVYKHAGDYQAAADYINEARELDLADRFLNAKCVRYMLLADRHEPAREIIGLFTREGVDKVDNLTEMQCVWFEQYYGDSALRVKDYPLALKKLHQVDKHFSAFEEDQIDFHAYCMRKMTLGAYVRLLRMEDNLPGHKFFCKAAKSAIRTYISLYDNKDKEPSVAEVSSEAVIPAAPVANETVNPEEAGLSEKELKKLRSKQRRDAARNAASNPAPPAADATPEKEDDGNKKDDEDPKGLKFFKTITDPLENAATTFLQPLLKHASNDFEVHFLAMELYLKKDKILLALKSLQTAYGIEGASSNNELKYWTIKVHQHVKGSSADETVKAVFEEGFGELVKDSDLKTFLSDWEKTLQADDIIGRCYLEQAKYLLDSSTKDSCVSSLSSISPVPNHSWKDYKFVSETLLNVFEATEASSKYNEQCKAIYPLSPFFSTKIINN